MLNRKCHEVVGRHAWYSSTNSWSIKVGEESRRTCHVREKSEMYLENLGGELGMWEHQYSETNVMRFLFSLLRIKGLYIFGTLLAHSQEVLHNRHLVYCVFVMSVGCTKIEASLLFSCSELTTRCC
jgi:hypothetical protein